MQEPLEKLSSINTCQCSLFSAAGSPTSGTVPGWTYRDSVQERGWLWWSVYVYKWVWFCFSSWNKMHTVNFSMSSFLSTRSIHYFFLPSLFPAFLNHCFPSESVSPLNKGTKIHHRSCLAAAPHCSAAPCLIFKLERNLETGEEWLTLQIW